MARMIPSFIDESTPPGERDVFSLLASGPDDWVVLHSLELAPWNRGLRTEIDFVVIIPDLGILCIEVKSHLSIVFDGQRWHPSAIRRSPFKQAADGRFTFYRRMRELAPRLKHVPIVSCCIFTRSNFDLTPNLSVAPWELMDARSFHAISSSEAFCTDIRARVRKSIDVDERLYPLLNALSLHDMDTLIESSVPIQKYRPNAREEISQREELVARILLDQQKPVVHLSEYNDRIIVSGGAGTGKTLIAMEVAQWKAEEGYRVALLCFNKLVGDWMLQRISQDGQIPPTLVIGPTIRILADLTGVAIPKVPTRDYWEKDLPQQLEELIKDPDLKAISDFDYMIVDEAQDILARPRLWQCLTMFLRGGLENGMFVLFGDFDHQVLQDHEQMERQLKTIEAVSRPVRWHLSENCRNYRIVGETALRLGGMSPSVYTGYLRSGGGQQNYDIYFYKNHDDQLSKLRQWLKEFKALGYKAAEVTLLSFRSDESSSAAALRNAGYKVQPAWQSGKGIAYSSVHAFKGLENKIIILSDVVLKDNEFHRDLFYTGMTRATECVRVLCDVNSEAVLCGWLGEKGEQ